jgi:hypothetical protein
LVVCKDDSGEGTWGFPSAVLPPAIAWNARGVADYFRVELGEVVALALETPVIAALGSTVAVYECSSNSVDESSVMQRCMVKRRDWSEIAWVPVKAITSLPMEIESRVARVALWRHLERKGRLPGSGNRIKLSSDGCEGGAKGGRRGKGRRGDGAKGLLELSEEEEEEEVFTGAWGVSDQMSENGAQVGRDNNMIGQGLFPDGYAVETYPRPDQGHRPAVNGMPSADHGKMRDGGGSGHGDATFGAAGAADACADSFHAESGVGSGRDVRRGDCFWGTPGNLLRVLGEWIGCSDEGHVARALSMATNAEWKRLGGEAYEVDDGEDVRMAGTCKWQGKLANVKIVDSFYSLPLFSLPLPPHLAKILFLV